MGQRASGSHVHSIFFPQTAKIRVTLVPRNERIIFPDGSKSDLYLIEESLWKLLEALGTNKALFMVQLSVTVDYLLSCSKAALASLTGRIGQGISNAGRKKGRLKKKHITTKLRRSEGPNQCL